MDDLERLAGPLADLHARTGTDDPWLHPAFLLPWTRQAMRDGMQPHCLLIWDGGELAAFLPLFRKRQAPWPVGCRRLSPPLSGTTPPFDVLTDQDPIPVAAELAGRLGSDWDLQWFPGIREESLLATLWRSEMADAGHATGVISGQTSLRLRIPCDWDAFVEGLSRSLRYRIRRQRRNLFDRAGARLVSHTPETPRLDPGLLAMKSVLARSWKGTARMRRHGLEDLERLARSLDRSGMLRIHWFELDGAPIAYLMEIDGGSTRFEFHNAHDAAHSKLGPGFVLITEAIRLSAGDRRTWLDWGGNREYFAGFSTDEHRLATLQVWRRGGAAPLRRATSEATRALAAAPRRWFSDHPRPSAAHE
jgi:hypothetical protein